MTTPIITSTLTPEFGWNETAGRYIELSTGRFVTFAEVRDALETVIDASGVRIGQITEQLMSGQLNIADWQIAMMEQIKIEHTAAAAAANGGWAQMSQSDWGAVGRMIRDQYEYLNRFAEQLASGEQALNGVVPVRADMYADAARATFEEMRRRYERLYNGATEEIRVLGEADHCNGCLEQAGMGWQPVGTLMPIGSQECITRCHCRYKYRRMGADGKWIITGD